jgi:hypothetical protein
MSKWRKKPIVIEAFKWTGGPDQTEEPDWIVDALRDNMVIINRPPLHFSMSIITLEGIMSADSGDYIIKGVQGELYPCKPDIFKATYEKVEE